MKLFFSILTLGLCQSMAYADSLSVLNQTVSLEDVGDIRFRAPINEPNGKLPILLVHGVYGGASHRAFNQLLPLLDKAGEQVYIVDLPGVGESVKIKKQYKIEDLDFFLQKFISQVIKTRTTIVAESLLGVSALKVAADYPTLVRRVILLSPTGINSLATGPSAREQRLFERLYADDKAASDFYQNLLVDNSLRFFLRFAFFDDSLVNEQLLNDYREMRKFDEQKYLTIAFVGGQLYRPFIEASQNVFVPVLAIFGAEYEAFADTPPTKASQFKELRPDFEYLEIPGSGSSVQREKPEVVAQEIIIFNELD